MCIKYGDKMENRTIKMYFEEGYYFESGEGQPSKKSKGLYIYPIADTIKIVPLILHNNKHVPAKSSICIPLESVPELIMALKKMTAEEEEIKEEIDIVREFINGDIQAERYKVHQKTVFYNSHKAIVLFTKEERRKLIEENVKNMLFDIDPELLALFTDNKDIYWMVAGLKHLQNGGSKANKSIERILIDMEGLVDHYCESDSIMIDAISEEITDIGFSHKYNLEDIEEKKFEYETLEGGAFVSKMVYAYMIKYK
jgi:hypothetical protein